jgi:hypothetical protein
VSSGESETSRSASNQVEMAAVTPDALGVGLRMGEQLRTGLQI